MALGGSPARFREHVVHNSVDTGAYRGSVAFNTRKIRFR